MNPNQAHQKINSKMEREREGGVAPGVKMGEILEQWEPTTSAKKETNQMTGKGQHHSDIRASLS